MSEQPAAAATAAKTPAPPSAESQAAPASPTQPAAAAATTAPAAKSDETMAAPPAPVEEKSAAQSATPMAATAATPAAETAAPAVSEAEALKMPVSAFAPADDLTTQMNRYLSAFKAAAESEEAFKDAEGRLHKDAAAAAVVALNLGMHDQPNKYKDNAYALVKALQDLEQVGDLAAAKAAVEKIDEALAGKGPTGELKWEKVATLESLMEVVPLIRTSMNRYVKERYLTKKSADTTGYSATLAAIAQASMFDLSEAKTPEKQAQWKQFCLEMRNASAQMNAAIHRHDQAAVDAAMPILMKSCSDCHTVFYPEALGKDEGE